MADLCIQLQDEHDASVCELLDRLAGGSGSPIDVQALADYRRLRQGLYLSIIRLRGARRFGAGSGDSGAGAASSAT